MVDFLEIYVHENLLSVKVLYRVLEYSTKQTSKVVMLVLVDLYVLIVSSYHLVEQSFHTVMCTYDVDCKVIEGAVSYKKTTFVNQHASRKGT